MNQILCLLYRSCKSGRAFRVGFEFGHEIDKHFMTVWALTLQVSKIYEKPAIVYRRDLALHVYKFILWSITSVPPLVKS